MNVLLIGSGGREHALSWKLAQSPILTKLYVAPGNPGIGHDAECVDLNVSDHDAIIAFCADHAIDLVVVGPEAPLVDGIADALSASGVLFSALRGRRPGWKAPKGLPRIFARA